MRWLVCAVFLVGPIFAEKERIEDDTFPELANDLLIEIQKRLREYDDTTSDEELGYDACAFQSTNGSIIRTQDSIQGGAEFINSLDVKYIPELDREYCLQSCCETTKCNLAVFKDKGVNHSCYLFDCGTPSVCVFTPHPGFSLHMLPNRQMTNKAQEMRADELQHLGMEKTTTTTTTTTVAPTTTTPTTTTTETTTTSTTTTTEAPDMHQPVALFGVCKDHKDCAGSFTECLAGYCLCRDNYHAQDGMCRKDCSRFEFECVNEGQPTMYPQCIAVYDKCNGLRQCKDGSDEMNCGYPNSQAVQVPQHGSMGQDPLKQHSGPQPQLPQQPLPQSYQPYQDPGTGPSYGYQPALPDRDPASYPGQIYNYGSPKGPELYQQQLGDIQNQRLSGSQSAYQQPHALPLSQQQLPQQQQPSISQQQVLSQPQLSSQQQPQQQPLFQQQPVQPEELSQQLSSQQGLPQQPSLSEPQPHPQQDLVDGTEAEPTLTGHVDSVKEQPGQQQPQSAIVHSDMGPLPERGHIRRPQVATEGGSVPPSSSNVQHQRKPGVGWEAAYEAQPPVASHPSKQATPPPPGQPVDSHQFLSNQGPVRADHMRPAPGPSSPASDQPAAVPNRSFPNDKHQPIQQQQQAPSGGGTGNDLSRNRYPQYNEPNRPGRVQNPPGYYRGSGKAGGYYNPGYSGSANTGGNRGGQYTGDYSQYYDPDQTWLQTGYGPDYDYYNNMDPGPRTPASSSDNPPGREGAGPVESTDKWPSSSSKEDKDSESMDVSHKQGSIVPHNDPKTHTSAEGDQNISLSQKSDGHSSESDSQSSESDSQSEESDSQSEEGDSQSAESDSHSLSDSQSPKSLNADHDSLVVSSSDDADDSNLKMAEQPAETRHHSKEEIDSESTQLVESNDSPIVKKVVDVQGEINEASQDASRSKTVMLALSNKSAIVALALGLVITAMLLVFVGCRLRNMRKRLRKGRPLNSNEADYLINGMYL